MDPKVKKPPNSGYVAISSHGSWAFGLPVLGPCYHQKIHILCKQLGALITRKPLKKIQPWQRTMENMVECWPRWLLWCHQGQGRRHAFYRWESRVDNTSPTYLYYQLASYSKFPSSSGFRPHALRCRTLLILSVLPKEIRLRVMMSQLDAVRAQDWTHQVLLGWGGTRTSDASCLAASSTLGRERSLHFSVTICRSKHPLCTNSCKRIRSDSWGPYLQSPM